MGIWKSVRWALADFVLMKKWNLIFESILMKYKTTISTYSATYQVLEAKLIGQLSGCF